VTTFLVAKDNKSSRSQLFRCDVTTGACKLVFKNAADVTLGQP
jgi:hypothetical protein